MKPTTTPAPRALNLLDVRRGALILKEIDLTAEQFAAIFKAAHTAAATDSGDTAALLTAMYPALKTIITLLSDSRSFWDFIADLYGMQTEELTTLPPNALIELFAALSKDEGISGFFSLSAPRGIQE